jgi:hypothetical protein
LALRGEPDMNWCERLWLGLFELIGFAALVVGGCCCAAAAELQVVRDASTISVQDGNRVVFRYRYADVPLKPYADQLVSPAGVQVLRDSPSDHKHHHGLMYAMAVDGVNFWEEHLPTSGRQRQKSIALRPTAVREGVESAGFVQQFEWMGPTSDRPLLLERRQIDVLRSADLGATLVCWRCRLQTPPDKEAVTLGGNPYYGLGMRFLVSMDLGGRFFNAGDAAAEILPGGQRLTPAKWYAYTANADGKPVTAAMFDHPANLRYPAKFFTMTQPFAYLSATLDAAKQPISVKAGKLLELCYGVALWDGQVDKATVEKLYRRWLASCAGS